MIIAGCGPTGAMLAAELRLHDVRVLVLDTEPVSFVRIVGLHIRSRELMAMRGLVDRLLPHGRQRPAAGFFAAIHKPVPEGLDSAHAYLLGIPQPVVVRLLPKGCWTPTRLSAIRSPPTYWTTLARRSSCPRPKQVRRPYGGCPPSS